MTRKIFTFFIFKIRIAVFHTYHPSAISIIYKSIAKFNPFKKINKKPTSVHLSCTVSALNYFIILKMLSDFVQIEFTDSPKADVAFVKRLYAFASARWISLPRAAT